MTETPTCPGCGEETYRNDDGEAVYCGICSEEILTNSYRTPLGKARW